MSTNRLVFIGVLALVVLLVIVVFFADDSDAQDPTGSTLAPPTTMLCEPPGYDDCDVQGVPVPGYDEPTTVPVPNTVPGTTVAPYVEFPVVAQPEFTG